MTDASRSSLVAAGADQRRLPALGRRAARYRFAFGDRGLGGEGSRPVACIPDNEPERLKKRISVQRLVETTEIELKKAGEDWLGRSKAPRQRHTE